MIRGGPFGRAGTAWIVGVIGVAAVVVFPGLRGGATLPGRAVPAAGETHPEDAPGSDAGLSAAGLAVDRLQLFRTGNGGSRMELDGPQLTAILRHTMPGVLPEGVEDPSVHIVDGQVRVHAHASPALVPGGRYLTEAIAALPETVEVELRGRVENERLQSIAYRVEEIRVEGVALPGPVVALVIGAIQLGDDPRGRGEASGGSPPDAAADGAPGETALRMRWPVDAGVLRVLSDRLVLERAEPLAQQAVDGSGGA